MIRTLDGRRLGLDAVVRELQRPPAQVPAAIQDTVTRLLADVRLRGDVALLEHTARLDGFVAATPADLAIPPADFASADAALAPEIRAAIAYAARRIERYQAEAMPRSWRYRDETGSVLGQEIRPLDRVGIYVPGGRAAYPSTVLMTAVPARVAGVREIVLVTPPGPDGRVAPAVLAAARAAGVTEGYRVGGAQAVAALAHGTPTIRRVDKIVGPGNIYVALAKSRVFGEVGIDMVAGPSEVLVVADASADPVAAAADLLAQAEHDPMARSVLVTDAPDLAAAVGREVARRLPELPRQAIAGEALTAHGALVLVDSLDDAVELANRLAPEHLELLVAAPDRWLRRVRHAGAVFVGGYTPEVVGDYVAGPSHVLPTAGTARFSSPLGVEDFVRRMSVIEYSSAGLAEAWPHVRALAGAEGLAAHGTAAEVRVERQGGGRPA